MKLSQFPQLCDLLICRNILSYSEAKYPYLRGRIDKVNAELVTLTYGTIVAQLCSDYDSNYAEVNKQLDRMGYNIGMRLVEDFFAKSGTQRCANFRETAETISKVTMPTLLMYARLCAWRALYLLRDHFVQYFIDVGLDRV